MAFFSRFDVSKGSTGVGRIFPHFVTGGGSIFYRSWAYIILASTGVRRTIYRSWPYIFRRNLLINRLFWKHKLLNMMLKKLKNITKDIDVFFGFNGEKHWK